MTATPATTLYYWPCSFVLQTRHFVQTKTYQRLAATLILSKEAEFEVSTKEAGQVRAQAMVLGPKARREGLALGPQACWLLDAGIGSPSYYALMSVLNGASHKKIEPSQIDWSLLERGYPPRRLHSKLISKLAGEVDVPLLDGRIVQLLGLIAGRPRDELSVAALAQAIGLSESRLRSVVKRELGCTLSQYMRWAAGWSTLARWHPGMTLTDAAHEAGFHDLAHANHTFNEMFGLSPTRILREEGVKLVRC